ncbi:MAG TPA: leucyl aminopeptidase [Polyangiales bacterium]|jgi:leucyl aminopeptidase|nr:leucyl aminopeptidase [Polyangiales bacterium]
MKITLSNDAPQSVAVDVLVVGVSGKKPAAAPHVQKLDKAMGGALAKLIKEESFEAKRGKTLSLEGRGRVRAKQVMLVGLGEAPLNVATARLLGVKAGRSAMSRTSLAVVAPPALEAAPLSALAEGIATGAYRYTRYLTGSRIPKKQLAKAAILLDKRPNAAQQAALREGNVVSSAVNFARDLVNCPANDLSATQLANHAAERAKAAGITCKVWDKKGIEKLGMPLLLAVNRGSKEEPRFIHMTYKPKSATKDTPKVVFVGKGLTFDSGGLCIKPSASMLDMKMDMAGAATTIATVAAAAELGLPIEVHGLVASTDNMTGGDAYRPGDVFPSRDGKTVEIINTDAEGRLVLADALAYARELAPTYLVDHATLTGACMVALGSYRAGLFCNDDELATRYQRAAESSGENFWRMPLDEDLKEELKSSIADLKHTGSRNGGAITAALFLQEFVGDSKWVHLDIAAPAHLDKPQGIMPKGGTGFGVLTALQLLRELSS